MSDSESINPLSGSEKMSSEEPSSSVSEVESSPDDKNSRTWNLGYYNKTRKVAADKEEYLKKQKWKNGPMSFFWYNKRQNNKYYRITGTFLGNKKNFTDRRATKIIKNGDNLPDLLKKSKKQRKNGNLSNFFNLMQLIFYFAIFFSLLRKKYFHILTFLHVNSC